jgi:hypothetical protein
MTSAECSAGSESEPQRRDNETFSQPCEKRQVLIEHVLLPIGQSLLDATPLLVENPSGNALDLIGVDLMCAGWSVEGLFVYLTLAGSPPDNASPDFTKKPRCGKRLASSDSSIRRANALRRWREKASD